jgi:3',5'-cyclic-AMP phosphodiesterase
VHSGTVSSMRVRGTMPPSYNVIELDDESVSITLHEPGQGEEGKEPLASFSRSPVTTSEFFPDFERFVLYDKLPFLR